MPPAPASRVRDPLDGADPGGLHSYKLYNGSECPADVLRPSIMKRASRGTGGE